MLGKIDKRILFWSTLVGGAISSLVKYGTEANMPPRVVGEISPPGAHIDSWLGWLGIHSHSLDYVYQGITIPGAVVIYHWLFSFFFTFVYVFCSAYYPKIRLWYGAVYGTIITATMHALFIPLFGLRKPVYLHGEIGWFWNLNSYEMWSEIIGHIWWGVSIEICLIAVLGLYARPLQGLWVKRN